MRKLKQPIVAVPVVSIVLLMDKILRKAKELDLISKTSEPRPIDEKDIKF